MSYTQRQNALSDCNVSKQVTCAYKFDTNKRNSYHEMLKHN